MHEYVKCPILYFLFFYHLFHTWELSWLCHNFTVYIQMICISHNPAPLSLRAACLLVKAGESQDGHTEVSCTWLRWYSTESELLSKMTVLSFFSLKMMHCSSTVPTPISSCPDAVLFTHRWEPGVCGAEWRKCFCLYSEKKRMRQREKKSIHLCSFHPPLHAQTRGCCSTDWWARGERRGGFNWSGISSDRSM